jgi:hypothetical protein
MNDYNFNSPFLSEPESDIVDNYPSYNAPITIKGKVVLNSVYVVCEVYNETIKTKLYTRSFKLPMEASDKHLEILL